VARRCDDDDVVSDVAAVRDQVRAVSGAAALQRSDTSAVIDSIISGRGQRAGCRKHFDLLGASALGRGPPAHDEPARSSPSSSVMSSASASADRGAVTGISRCGLDYVVAGATADRFSDIGDASILVPLRRAANPPGWDREQFRNIVRPRQGCADASRSVAAAQGATATAVACDRRSSGRCPRRSGRSPGG
jgi:hypothetical protein